LLRETEVSILDDPRVLALLSEAWHESQPGTTVAHEERGFVVRDSEGWLIVENPMSTLTLEGIQDDHLVMSVARALAVANEAAVAEGIVPADSLATISEEPANEEGDWRIHYGPRDYVNRRGGDLIVLVDQRAGEVRRIIRGQ
jgi:hypothetical protein